MIEFIEGLIFWFFGALHDVLLNVIWPYVLPVAVGAAAAIWLYVEWGRLAAVTAGRKFEDLAAELRGRSFWWYFWVFVALAYLFWFLKYLGMESAANRGLVLSALVFFPVARAARSRGWWIFEALLLVGVVASFYDYLVSPEGFGFTNKLFWALLILVLGTLCMAVLTRGYMRALFSLVAAALSLCSVLAFLDKGSYHDFFFWNLAVMAVGSGLMVLVSKQIVHMAFWLLSSLAAVAGFYLLLGADFLGFTQVLVYIGGILILFLFGVMLTHRADVPLKPKATWRALWPAVAAGVAVTAMLVFLAAGNNWSELDQKDLPTLGTVTQLSSYYEPNANIHVDLETNQVAVRPAAEPTAFGLGLRFMSTYILPFEVVSILLLVAMIGATYIARGRSEGDVTRVESGEGGEA